MQFDLNKCVNYITENITKQISEIFGKRLAEFNITRIQWIGLYYIYTNGEISQRELSNYMHITDSSAMRLIERLERDGLLIRSRSKIDRRILLISLTDKGTNLIKKLLPLGQEFSQELINGITEEELIIFQKVMNKMLDNVKTDKYKQ